MSFPEKSAWGVAMHSDHRTHSRIPKESADWYRDVIRWNDPSLRRE